VGSIEPVLVAVGSTRGPKLDAVRLALASIGDVWQPHGQASEVSLRQSRIQFEVIGVSVPSGVSHTPQNRTEVMAGARGRAEALIHIAREQGNNWRYFVGLEGGLNIVHEGDRRWVFLENWAFVSDGSGRESYGQSGGILLPEPLASEVTDRGTELAEAIDSYAGGRGIRDSQGAWGVLTRNRITRQDSFRIAVIQAFAPFFNSSLYP